MIDVLLLGIAALCFLLAAFGVAARVNLVAVGLFAFTLVPLLHAIAAT